MKEGMCHVKRKYMKYKKIINPAWAECSEGQDRKQREEVDVKRTW